MPTAPRESLLSSGAAQARPGSTVASRARFKALGPSSARATLSQAFLGPLRLGHPEQELTGGSPAGPDGRRPAFIQLPGEEGLGWGAGGGFSLPSLPSPPLSCPLRSDLRVFLASPFWRRVRVGSRVAPGGGEWGWPLGLTAIHTKKNNTQLDRYS